MSKTSDKRPTISQVAIEAGVARSTVSRAFSQPEILTRETVARVLDVAKRLGYSPNPVAQALSTGRSRNIALIVPDVANPFFPPLIRAAQLKAEEYDLCVFLGDSDENPVRENQLLERFINQVDGVVLVSSRLTDAQILHFAGRVPLVLINRDVPNISRVLIDSASGVVEAVRHLAHLGHKHIAYVSGPATSWSNTQRRMALRQATKTLGVKLKSISANKSTFESGRRIAEQIINSGATGCVAFDDLLAQGILFGLAEMGVRVPLEFSVVGCDDVLGSTTSPPLTTVSNHCVAAGEIAISLLVNTLRSEANKDVQHVLGTHLVVRNSTAEPSTSASNDHSLDGNVKLTRG
jgi:LacI family transcriptional regulator